ncbi:MAG: asparaginase [Acutalibacteraceae bacterium]
MKRILLVLTGGTIGSHIQNGQAALDEGALQRLGDYCREQLSDNVILETLQPISFLSENSTPQTWSALLASLKRVLSRPCDGVILAHGSDTLAYVSALLGFLFASSAVPIVVTAANRPFGETGSNAGDNLLAAARLILSETVRGVLTVYRDTDGSMPVYLPTRITEADTACDRFTPFGGVPFGYMQGERFIPCVHPSNPPLCALGAAPSALSSVTVSFDRAVLALRPYPGLRYDWIDPSGYAAVLHGLYHSGTACTQQGPYALPDFVTRCRERDIPVYMASVKPDAAVYAGSEMLWQAGGIPLLMQSFESAYVKLCIAYNQTDMPAEEYMKRPIAFENLICP